MRKDSKSSNNIIRESTKTLDSNKEVVKDKPHISEKTILSLFPERHSVFRNKREALHNKYKALREQCYFWTHQYDEIEINECLKIMKDLRLQMRSIYHDAMVLTEEHYKECAQLHKLGLYEHKQKPGHNPSFLVCSTLAPHQNSEMEFHEYRPMPKGPKPSNQSKTESKRALNNYKGDWHHNLHPSSSKGVQPISNLRWPAFDSIAHRQHRLAAWYGAPEDEDDVAEVEEGSSDGYEQEHSDEALEYDEDDEGETLKDEEDDEAESTEETLERDKDKDSEESSDYEDESGETHDDDDGDDDDEGDEPPQSDYEGEYDDSPEDEYYGGDYSPSPSDYEEESDETLDDDSDEDSYESSDNATGSSSEDSTSMSCKNALKTCIKMRLHYEGSICIPTSSICLYSELVLNSEELWHVKMPLRRCAGVG